MRNYIYGWLESSDINGCISYVFYALHLPLRTHPSRRSGLNDSSRCISDISEGYGSGRRKLSYCIKHSYKCDAGGDDDDNNTLV